MNTTEVTELQKYIHILKDKQGCSDDYDEKMKDYALKNINNLCESPEYAKVFHEIGGVSYLKMYILDSNDEIRIRTIDVMTTMAHKNPYCQEVLFKNKCFWQLLDLLDKDENETIRNQALNAILSIVKSYPAAQDAFLEYDGFSVLMRTLQSEVEKLQIKTARMLNKIILSRKEFQDNLYKLGYVHQLLELLQTTHNASHKHFLVMLNNLVTDHDGCLEICRNPSVALEGTLNLKIDSIEGIPHFSEELKYAKKLLITCFPHRLHDMDKTCT